jgi:AcrR family transcriptional regulator
LNSTSQEKRKRPSGRRPGDSGTREAILAAARHQFAERGFDRATIRAIAAEAAVDPALVSYFFGSKHALFAAAVELPFDPAAVVPQIFGGDPDRIGERFVRFMLSVFENPTARERITGVIRAAASEPQAAMMIRELITSQVMNRIAEQLDAEDADLRATLVGSQVIGLVMARYVVGVEPIASLPAERVAKAIAPTLQRYFTEPL